MTTTQNPTITLHRGDVVQDAYGNPAVVILVHQDDRGETYSAMQTVGSDRGRTFRVDHRYHPLLADQGTRQAEWARNIVREIKGWPTKPLPAEPFSDEALQEQAASSAPGTSRIAQALLTLDSPEDRRVASRHARIAMNMTGGRPSDQTRSAVEYVRTYGAAYVTERDNDLCARNR